MRKYDYYWKTNRDWYYYTEDEEFPFPVIRDDAPEEAKESYRNYLRQKGYLVEEREGDIEK